MPASAFAIEIGELIPSGIFLLLALVLPFVFYHVGRRLFAQAAKTSARVALHFDRELLKAAGLGTAPDAVFCGGGAAAPCAEACDGGKAFWVRSLPC